MTTKEIRPETIQVTEQAAWAQMQNLQKLAFEKGGLPTVIQLNNFLAETYEVLTSQGQRQGKSGLLMRGISAGIFITDLLPEVEKEFLSKAAGVATSINCDDLIRLRDRLLKGITGQ